ncbi:MAG: Ig-like domain-containing protein [Bacteroidota bacterium]
MTAEGIWTSTDETVATVDVNGLVTALSAGTTTINYAGNQYMWYYYSINLGDC